MRQQIPEVAGTWCTSRQGDRIPYCHPPGLVRNRKVKRGRLVLRTLFMAAVLASPGAAQLVEVGGGIAIPTGDLNVNRNAGFSGHASVWLELTDRLLVGSALEYGRLPFDTFNDGEIVASDGFALSMFGLSAQARVMAVGPGAALQPSLVIGIGATRHKAAAGRVLLDNGLEFALQPDAEWGFTAAGGLGLYVPLLEPVGIQADARYVLTVLQETKPKQWQFNAALQVRVN